MKKILIILVLTCVIMGAAFAQAKPATPAPAPAQPAKPATPPPATSSDAPKNSLGIDLFQITKGFIASDNDTKTFIFITSIGYEALVAPHWSIGVDADTYFMSLNNTPGFYLCIAGEGRYYPQSANFEKFFLGTTLGFNVLSIDGSSKPEDGGFFGLTASLKTGYKIIIGKIYLEPSLAYVLSKSSIFGVPTPLGWNGGLRFGFVF